MKSVPGGVVGQSLLPFRVDFRQPAEETAGELCATVADAIYSFPIGSSRKLRAGLRVPRGINLVVTCTKKKLRTVRESLQLRSVEPVLSVQAKARKWIRRLESAPGETVSPSTLYGGDHWSVVRELATKNLFEHKDIRIWICSAGYGLIPMWSKIHPYSATFSPGHPDSVSLGAANEAASAHAQWWDEMTQWDGPQPGSPRSIAALAEAFPDDLLLVVMSGTYLQATTPDIRRAIEHPTFREDRFAILCSGVRELEGLSSYLLPCNARFQQRVGGALSSLNVRIARYLIDNTTPAQWSCKKLQAILTAWLKEQPDRVIYGRSPMTDAELINEIGKALEADPALRPTPLLRKLRDSGRACEHSRFVRLFHETVRLGNGEL